MSDKIHDQADKQPRRLNFKTPDHALRRDDAPPSKYFAGPPPNGKTANQRIAEITNPSRAKSKPPATQHRCGHPLELGRRHKSRCTACIAVTHAEEAKAHAAATVRERLPHGSRFDVTFDATLVMWDGILRVPDSDSSYTAYHATARGVFPLLAKLDKLYRKGKTQP